MPVIPGLGELERWQLIFFLVGAPGLLLALIVGKTLKDPNPTRAKSNSDASVAKLLRFILSEWQFCALYILSVALIIMVLNAHIAWLPAAMIRSHGVDEGEMGMLFGPLYLVAGSAGTLLSGWYVSRAKSDMLGRTLTFMLTCTVLLFVPAISAPLVGSFSLAMILIALVVFLTSGIVALSSLPFQFSAPLAVRGQAIAVLSLAAALLGTGLGPLGIGMLSDFLTDRVQHPLSVSLAILAGLLIPVIVGLQLIVIRQHRLKRLDLRPGTLSESVS
ncbi:MAG: MFS transporter [Spongiibacteraceae bacterium]